MSDYQTLRTEAGSVATIRSIRQAYTEGKDRKQRFAHRPTDRCPKIITIVGYSLLNWI
jgi:hypothetical protein